MAVRTASGNGGKPANAPSAAPGTAGPDSASADAKPPKVEKKPFGQRNAEGELENKLTWERGRTAPEGYDAKIHEPLARKDFATLADFLQFRADRLNQQAIDAQKAADDEKSGVGKATKAKQKKLVKLKSSLDELLKELKDAGVDVDKVMATN